MQKSEKIKASSLDSTGSNHLLLQVLLVLADAAVPAGDGLVLANHDVLGDLVEKSGKEWVSMCLLDHCCSRSDLAKEEAYLKS